MSLTASVPIVIGDSMKIEDFVTGQIWRCYNPTHRGQTSFDLRVDEIYTYFGGSGVVGTVVASTDPSQKLGSKLSTEPQCLSKQGAHLIGGKSFELPLAQRFVLRCVRCRRELPHVEYKSGLLCWRCEVGQ